MVDPVAEFAATLQLYGPWAVTAAACFALIFVARAYVTVRDRHDAELKEITLGTVKLVERSTEVSAVTRGSLDRVAGTLTSIERRLEDVERTIEK